MLTDMQIRKASPKERAYKLSDGSGLHLFVTPAGGKLWRYRYEFGGKEKLLSLGPYPDTTLSDARAGRDRAKELLRDGKDPSTAKRLKRFKAVEGASETFEVLAREWFDLNRDHWVKHHADEVIRSLEAEVFPSIGSLPTREVSPRDVLEVLRKIEARDAKETARRVRQRIGSVYTYAIATSRAEHNPAALLVGAMAPMVKGRQPAITDLEVARAMLRHVEATPGHAVTKLAIRLLALTAVRPGTLAETPWTELPPGSDMWIVPAARMKLRKHLKNDDRRDHMVPLSRQAIETIGALRTITGRGPLVFPNARHAHKPMSENAMGYMLNRAGYHHRHVPHGWRSTFSTVMNERFPADRAVIDLMLAHVPKDAVEAAYNRAQHLGRRIELAQLWGDLITEGLPPPMDLAALPRL
jgi:Phage integrase family.